MKRQSAKGSVVTGLALASVSVLGLSGCALGTIHQSGDVATKASSGVTISGGIHGGQQAVSGSTIQLYAAGAPVMPSSGSPTGGYGQGAIALIPVGSMTVGSTNNYSPGGASGCAYTAGNTNSCTSLPQSDANGNFTITGSYTCPSTASQVYIVATGGNPGIAGTVNNPYLAMMAGLGTCAAGGTLSSALTININEVTTVSTVWALQQFMTTPTGTAASGYVSQGGATAGVGVNIGAPSGPVGGYGGTGVQTAIFGLQNAFSMINNLTNISTGSSGTGTAGTALNSWATPWAAKINTLADILAACINTDPTGGDATCSSLMSAATPTSATAAKDTIQATWYMAQNPTNNVSTLFNFVSSTAPFSALSAAPNDWGIFVGLAPTFTAGGAAVGSPLNGAFDEYGHVWLTNLNTTTTAPTYSAPFVSELAGDGSVLAGPFGNAAVSAAGGAFATANTYAPTGGGYSSGTGCTYTSAHTLTYTSNGSKAIAVDLNNVVWTNNPDDAVAVCTSSTSIKTLFRVSGSTGFSPSSSGWVAPAITTGLVENGSTYSGLGVDSTGNVYISNSSTSSGKQQQYAAGSGTYVAGAALGASSPSATVVDTNTNNGGPFIWTSGQKNCPSAQGQIYQQPLSAFTTATSVYTYQNSTCTSLNGTSGTVVNINAATQNPFGMAVDRNNNLWVANSVGNTVSFLAAGATGVLGTGSNSSVTSASAMSGLATPYAVAVDGNNAAWFASTGSAQPYYAVALTATLGSPITLANAPQLSGTGNSGLGFQYTGSSIPFPKTPKAVAIDPSGNVWYFNSATGSVINYVSVLVGQAAPVMTPLALQVKANMIGQKP